MTTDESQIGKEKTPAHRRADLPEFLQKISAKQRKKDAANQKLWAEGASSPFVPGSQGEIARARAVRLEADWRATIATLQAQVIYGMDTRGIKEHNNAYYNAARQLAEALAAQGKFAEAAHWVQHDHALAAEYQALHGALVRADDERCGADCDLKFAMDPTLLTQDTIMQETFSPAHNAVVHVLRCNVCGTLNARPLGSADAHHLKQRQARRTAAELTKGMSPARAAAALQSANLTPEKVFA